MQVQSFEIYVLQTESLPSQKGEKVPQSLIGGEYITQA
jgi:hypothetical protein